MGGWQRGRAAWPAPANTSLLLVAHLGSGACGIYTVVLTQGRLAAKVLKHQGLDQAFLLLYF